MPEDKYLPIPSVEKANEMNFLVFRSIQVHVWLESFILNSRPLPQNTTNIQKQTSFFPSKTLKRIYL